jgi:hypothetical protein
MPKKRATPERIIGLLRQVEVEIAQGRTVGEVCRGLGVSEAAARRAAGPRGLLLAPGGRLRMIAHLGHHLPGCPCPLPGLRVLLGVWVAPCSRPTCASYRV